VLSILLVENGLRNFVARGENAGRTLQHVNTVRAQIGEFFPRRSRARGGTLVLSIPPDAQLGRSSLIAFSQNARSLRVIAVTEVPLELNAS